MSTRPATSTTLRREVVAGGQVLEAAAMRAQRSIAQALFGDPRLRVGRDGLDGRFGDPRLLMGRYRLGGRLGAGGQGTVWQAFDERLRRDVAVKVSSTAGIVDGVDEGRARWIRHEARMLGRLAHPNVVAVFDLGVHPASAFGADSDGVVPIAVMELVRGETLMHWLARAERSPAEIAAVFCELAEGLGAAHDAGLVHCDVKPGNVLLTAEGVPKLGDFGLAHVEQRWRTRTGEDDLDATAIDAERASSVPMGGTPLYMAPEQFGGGRLSPAADQYALAVTWFEALFARLPHVGRGASALLEAKRAGAPPRPSGRIPRRAYAALCRALEPDPGARYPSVRAFAAAMRLPGRRTAMGFAAAAAFVGVAAASVMTPRAPEGCASEQLRRPPAVVLEVGDAATTGQLGGRLVARWNDRRGASVDVRRTVCAAPRPDPGATACLDRFDATVAALLRPGDIRTRAAAERALSIVEALPEPTACLADRAWIADAELDLVGLEQRLRSDADVLTQGTADVRARRPLQALATLEPLLAEGPARVVFANEVDLTRAAALIQLGRFEDARAAYGAVWDRTVRDDASLDAARAAAGLAHVVGFALADPEGGLAWIRHGRAQLERFGDAPATAADLAASAASVLAARGEFAGALAECEQAIAWLAEVDGEDAARITLVENAAVLQEQLGDTARAEARLREVLAWRERHLGSDHPDVARPLRTLAFLEQRRGDVTAAAALLERALAIHGAAPSPDELEIAALEGAKAGLALERGDVPGALRSIERADTLRRRHLPPDHPDLAAASVMHLDVLVRAGDLEAANSLAHARRDELAVLIPQDSDRALDLEALLAMIAGAKGRTAEARSRLVHLVEAAERRGTRDASLALWSAQVAALQFNDAAFAEALAWAERSERHLAAFGPDAEAAAILQQIDRGLEAVGAAAP